MRINGGVFDGCVGVIDGMDDSNDRVVVMVQIAGACGPSPVECESREIERE